MMTQKQKNLLSAYELSHKMRNDAMTEIERDKQKKELRLIVNIVNDASYKDHAKEAFKKIFH